MIRVNVGRLVITRADYERRWGAATPGVARLVFTMGHVGAGFYRQRALVIDFNPFLGGLEKLGAAFKK